MFFIGEYLSPSNSSRDIISPVRMSMIFCIRSILRLMVLLHFPVRSISSVMLLGPSCNASHIWSPDFPNPPLRKASWLDKLEHSLIYPHVCGENAPNRQFSRNLTIKMSLTQQ
jgi:hypothetical protein